MQYLVATPYTKHNLMRVTVLSWRGQTNWEEVANYIRQHLADGVYNWEVDLRQLSRLDSLGIGILVSLNVVVTNAHGTFRLLVDRPSPINAVLEMSRLSVLLPIMNQSWE